MPTDNDGLQAAPELLGPAFIRKDDITEMPIPEAPKGPDAESVFDQQYREPFSGLLFLGKLEEEFSVFGHSFVIQTPSQNERLESGLIHKKYLNSLSSEIGWAAIVVATYLRSVDGTELPRPIGPAETGIRDRFNWIIDNIHGQVINRIFERCLALDNKVTEALDELERLGEF